MLPSNSRLIGRGVSLLLVFAVLVTLIWLVLRPVQAGGDPAPLHQDEQPAVITVDSFSPTEVTRSETPTPVIITGTNFPLACSVHLVPDGGGDPIVMAATSGDASTITIEVGIGVPVGNYRIKVVNEAGEGDTADELLLTVADPPPPPPPPVSVTGSEPKSIPYGQEGVLSVFGTNFTDRSMVRLVGIGLLQTTYLHSGALTAVLPATLPPGTYGVQVTDPLGGDADSPNKLKVVPPAPTAAPTMEPIPPTDIPPTPEPTDLPTPVPGQPSLVVRNFSADPATLAPGDTATLRFEVYNQGNRSAVGIAVAVNAEGKFIPANGQASAVVPDLGPGSVYTVTLSVIAGMDLAPGPTTIPLALTYRDAINNTYTGAGSLGVTISSPVETASQVFLSNVMMNPAPAEPGKPIKLTLFVTNSGNAAAQQVLVRVGGGENNVLLAGSKGDSVPLGDIPPATSALAELPMVVSSAAKSGPQSQPVTISFIRDGEAQQISGSLTVDIAKVITPAPLILLDAYDIGKDTLRPGERFTLKLTLENVGDGAADDLLVTFGTVQTTGGSSGDGSGSDSGSGGSGGGDTSVTPSTTFAPVGAGGTLYVGTVDADGGQVEIEQDFLVNATVNSGLYNLPVTLRYLKPDGSAGQDVVQAAMMVVAPPRLQIRLPAPLPETANVGEPFPIALEIRNNGSKRADLTDAVSVATNGEIVEGAETFIGGIESTEDASLNVMVMPLEEGPVEVTITLKYMNDLNQEETIVRTYTVEAVAPPPPPDDMPPDMGVVPEPTPQQEEDDDTVGRFLRGLLGLGS